MKKTISVLMSACMLLSSAVLPMSAAAESAKLETFYSPKVTFNNNRKIYSFIERFPNDLALRLSDTEKASGKYSLYVDTKRNLTDATDVEQYFGNTADANYSMPSNMASGKDYEFSIKVKIAEGGSLDNMRVYQTGQSGYYFVRDMTKTSVSESDPNGWVTYSQTFNSGSNNGPYLHLTLGGAENVYIDDIYLKNVTDNTVLLDYGFEDAKKVDMFEPSEVKAEATDYGKLKLTWRNPMNKNIGWITKRGTVFTDGTEESGILNVSLYDVTDDPTADVSDIAPIFSLDKGKTNDAFADVSTEPNKEVFCTLTGLESDKEYTYKLVITTDKFDEDGNVTNNVSEKLITAKTMKIPEGWKPALELNANFHHITPTGFMNDGADPSIAIAFHNPKSSNINEITLDKVVNGEAIRIDGTEFSKANNAVNNYEVNGLVKGEKYTYKLNCEFTDGTVESCVFEATAGTTTNPSKVGSWVTFYSKGKSENTPGIVRFDTTEKHSGNSSAYMSTVFSQNEGNRYVYLACNGLSMKAGKSYKLEFWAKGNNVNNLRVYPGWGNSSKMAFVSGVTDEWQHFEYDFANLEESGNQMFFLTDGSTEDFWVDDVILYSADDSDKKNLLTDADFETDQTDKLAALGNVTYEPLDGKVNISWQNALPSLTDHVRIYEEFDSTKSLKGKYTGTSGTVFELGNNTEHKLVLVAVDANGQEGAEASITVIPSAPSYTISDVTFTKGDKKLQKLESGEIVAGVKVKNKDVEGLKLTLIAALYDGYKMVASSVKEETFAEDESVVVPVTTSITVPDDDKQYTLKLFMWDDRDNKAILRNCETISSPEPVTQPE